MNRTFGTQRAAGTLVTIEGREFARIGTTYYNICGYCSGTGYRPGYGYSDGSRCWPCGYLGIMKRFAITGTLEQATKIVQRRVKAAAARLAKNLRNAQDAVTAHAEWMRQHPGTGHRASEVLRNEAAFSPLLRELAGAFMARELSEKQLDLIATLYTRETERATVKQAENAAKAFIGAEGEKVTVTGTVTFTATYDGDYGMSTLVRITTVEGNSVSWYSKVGGIEKGDTITATGKVKAHAESAQYGKETKIFYVKLV